MSRRYALEFAPKALRALRKLDRPVVERIKAATESLRDDPRCAGARSAKKVWAAVLKRIET